MIGRCSTSWMRDVNCPKICRMKADGGILNAKSGVWEQLEEADAASDFHQEAIFFTAWSVR